MKDRKRWTVGQYDGQEVWWTVEHRSAEFPNGEGDGAEAVNGLFFFPLPFLPPPPKARHRVLDVKVAGS